MVCNCVCNMLTTAPSYTPPLKMHALRIGWPFIIVIVSYAPLAHTPKLLALAPSSFLDLLPLLFCA